MKILVASHRRSGTHLTIDSISNNASLDFEITNFDKVRNDAGLQTYGDKNLILKSHMNGNVFKEHLSDFDAQKIPIIYVYRDGRDVMQSLYNYENRTSDFKSFIEELNFYDTSEYNGELSKLEYWAFHVSSWLSKENVLPIRFDELRSSYNESIQKIFKYSGIELNSSSLKDIRQSNKLLYYIKKYILKQNLTTVAFNSGKSGNYSKYFDEDLNKHYMDVLVKYEIDKFF